MSKQSGVHLLRGAVLLLVGALGFWNIYSAQAQSEQPVDYVLVGEKIDIATQPNAVVPVVVPVRNTGTLSWNRTQLQLGTIFCTGDKDRPSVWQTEDWLSNTRIGLAGTGTTTPHRVINFNFTIKAPAQEGWYREYFQPVVNGSWLNGEPIVLQIQVGSDVTIQSADTPKEVHIHRKGQFGEWIENGYIVATLPISSGKSGYTTPAGKYKIINHIPDAYSSEYELWMPKWMGLSNERFGFVGHGMHALPYWRVNSAKYTEGKIYEGGRLYTQGKLYEGYSHLGKAVSHGCVRWGIKEAAILYDWAPNGTPVIVI